MKRTLALFMCLLLFTLCFTGCDFALREETRIYNRYKRFDENHKVGMTKQKVYDKLGCPNSYVDIQGKGHSSSKESPEDFEAGIFSEESVEWIYTVNAVPASSGRYILEITFDSEGKSVKSYLRSHS